MLVEDVIWTRKKVEHLPNPKANVEKSSIKPLKKLKSSNERNNPKMTVAIHYILVFTLHVNGLYASIKCHSLEDWV